MHNTSSRGVKESSLEKKMDGIFNFDGEIVIVHFKTFGRLMILSNQRTKLIKYILILR